MTPPTVYLDTTVLKFSATQLPRSRARKEVIDWGGKEQEVTVHDPIHIDPNDGIIGNQELKEESGLLLRLAELGKKGDIKYVIQTETLIESGGLPNMDSAGGRFYGTPFSTVEAPIAYGRIVVGNADEQKELQFKCLKSIRSHRFLDLQRMTGAYQGEGRTNRNQLLDAFHLWCAEYNQCEYFLTLDFKLAKVLKQNRRRQLLVNVVRPSELLAAVSDGT